MHKKADFARTLVLGNSGSGKSWLSEQLAKMLGVQAIDLDSIHWEPGGYGVARDKQLAVNMVRQTATRETWIIEGVFGWLAQEAVSRATTLIWLDIPVGECIDNIRQRGPRRGGNEEAFAALLAWATDYSHRKTSSSFAGHEGLFVAFLGQKVRLFSRKDVSQFLSNVQRL
jgi:adenylate kinase family enzyme